MRKFTVTGMSCAACSARVEKAVSAVDGVDSCTVNLLTNSMSVEGKASDGQIINAVKAAGYGARSADNDTSDETRLPQSQTASIVKRLVCSSVFLVALMYVSMGHVMCGAPLPQVLADSPTAIALTEMLLSAIILVINQRFFISGARGLVHRAPNMDTLVSLGSGASFVYSVCILFAMTFDSSAAHGYLHGLYFESAAMILVLITLGKLLESVSKGKTTKSLRSLMDLSPRSATLLIDGAETKVAIEQVKNGDILVVRSGDSFPVDGTVIDGSCSADESALTGESVPVDKTVGDSVSAGTVNRSGFVICEAQKVGEDTALSQIIQIVSDASASKAPIARTADKVSGIFVPVVLSIALITGIIWFFINGDVESALSRAISVLVISCPCALGLATPVAIMVGSGVGARNGILFKSAKALESTGRASIVVLDKTGTVTNGEMSVTDTITANGYSEKELIQTAYSIELKSEHPLGLAIVRYCEQNGVTAESVRDFRTVSGNGVEGIINGKRVRGGKFEFIKEECVISESNLKLADELAEQGKTPMFFSSDSQLVGIIAVSDTLKSDSQSAIWELRNMGLRVVMLTGDNERTARAIGGAAGVDEIIANVLPDKKAAEISRLRSDGNVIMVGDGINDAPALATADTGIAIGAGTDVAIDAADVVLMKSRLSDLTAAINLSRMTLRNIHQNLFWAFCYNSLGIPLAAGAFIPLLGWEFGPMFGAAAMSLSSFCVVINALRLNLVNIRKSARKKHKNNKAPILSAEHKEMEKMTKCIKIEGMMCGHCSGRVKKALEELEQVESAEVSHESGTATVTLKANVDGSVLKETVEAQGYKVISVR